MVKATQIKKRYLFIGLTLLIFLLVYSFSTQLLKAYAYAFRIDNASKGADCVLILSGNVETRPDHAAFLIHNGYAAKLYHTDQKLWNGRHKEILLKDYEKSQKILGTYNLSADIIPSTKGGATSTFDEAYDLVQYLRSHPMKHIIVVTDAFHTSRAHYAFRKILNLHGFETLKLEMSAAQNEIFDENNWYLSEAGIRSYILEPVKYLFYMFNTQNSTLATEN